MLGLYVQSDIKASFLPKNETVLLMLKILGWISVSIELRLFQIAGAVVFHGCRNRTKRTARSSNSISSC